MYKFDVEKVTNDCVQWIRNWFEKNGKGCNAIVGISGGKDSTVVAGLCVKALGKDRVIGVLMPNGIQCDLNDSERVVSTLGIKSYTINIKAAYDAIKLGVVAEMKDAPFSSQSAINLSPRLRMATLYAVSQSQNGRVANTCNKSEDYCGYSTRYGDSAGDFSPLSELTVTEVKQIGKYLGLPIDLVDKTPSDGLCGKSDEDNLGFTYAELDKYIREGIEPEPAIKERIDTLHNKNMFKLELMPKFEF